MSVFRQIVFCLVINFNLHTAEKFRYLSIEYPQVTYMNPKLFSFLNTSVRRYGRKDPVYYYELHADLRIRMDNKLSYHFYFYKEWMPNVYKPSFLEMHFKHCDLIEKDKFFGSALRQGNLSVPCPHPPGEYHLYNMTVPSTEIPNNFPVTKGRIYCNLTYSTNNDKNYIHGAGGYVNIEIKTINKKGRN